jgi:GNAT superfamily N-acetyltransferase
MGGLAVRAANAHDLLLATRLIGQLWEAHGEDNYDVDSLAVRADEIMRTCDCYVIGDPPVAFASLQDAGDHMVIRHFSVEAAERGKGVGRAAFEALEAHAFPGRASRLYASMDIPGPRAFWEKMGYDLYAYVMQRKGADA